MNFMAEGIHHFTVGNLACIAINDGTNNLVDAEFQEIFTPVAPDDLMAAVANLAERERQFCYNPLYIENHRLLIDTGHGADSEGKHGHMLKRLQACGISPADVEVVFITHAHGDHIHGLSNKDNQRVFPNARYIMGKKEWDFWMDDAATSHFSAEYMQMRRGKMRVMEGDLTFIEAGDEILPGITAIEAYGHTPGQLGVLLDGGSEKLLHLADTLHHIIQINHPAWSPRFDTLQDVSPITRRNLLQRAADENLLMYAYHLPFPALGCVTPHEGGFKWEARP